MRVPLHVEIEGIGRIESHCGLEYSCEVARELRMLLAAANEF